MFFLFFSPRSRKGQRGRRPSRPALLATNPMRAENVPPPSRSGQSGPPFPLALRRALSALPHRREGVSSKEGEETLPQASLKAARLPCRRVAQSERKGSNAKHLDAADRYNIKARITGG